MTRMHLEWEVRYDLSRALADRLGDYWLAPGRDSAFFEGIVRTRYVGFVPVRAMLYVKNNGDLHQKVTFAPPRLPSPFPRQVTHVLFMDDKLLAYDAYVRLDTPMYLQHGRAMEIDIDVKMKMDDR